MSGLGLEFTARAECAAVLGACAHAASGPAPSGKAVTRAPGTAAAKAHLPSSTAVALAALAAVATLDVAAAAAAASAAAVAEARKAARGGGADARPRGNLPVAR